MIGTIIFFIIGAVLFFHGFRQLSRKRLMENIPTSRIRSIALGLVEISGKAEAIPGTVVPSPFTAKSCIYYFFRIEEYKRRGKSSHWATIRKGEYRPEFYVRDDTGKILVNPEAAEYNVPKDFEYNSGLLNDPPAKVKEFLKENGLSHDGFLGLNKRMRYREYLIEPGQNVYVMGTAANDPVVSEENTSGLVMQKGTNEKFFYISDQSEKGVLSSLKWQAFGGITTGGMLCVVCLAYLLSALLH